MTTDQLRRELERLADTAPVPNVAGDTWRRARRSLVRDRVVGTLAVVALVAGGALAVSPMRDRADLQVAALPARISTTADAKLPVEHDLALGRVAAAYLVGTTDEVHVIVTTAVDGKHHLVSLPDFPRASDYMQFIGNQDLRLSPDGTELAYVYRQYDATPPGTGIAVVDLESGRVRRTQLAAAGVPGTTNGIQVMTLDWSPEGTYLVWSGEKQVGFVGHPVAGLIGPEGANTPVPADSNEYSVSDQGEVVRMTSDGAVRLWKDGADGPTVKVGLPGHTTTAELVDGVLSMLRTSPVDGGFQTYFLRHGAEDVSGRVADTVGNTHFDLGWTPDGGVLVAPVGADQSRQTVHLLELADDGTVTDSKVMTVDVPTAGQLTLATALPVHGEHVDQGQAAWAWLLVLGLGALVLAGWLLLRIRSSGRLRRGLATS